MDLHLQLIPGGLLQIIQDVALGEGSALGHHPCQRVYGPILQRERRNGTAAVIPTTQVELDPGDIDAGEELLFFGVLRFCKRRQSQKSRL